MSAEPFELVTWEGRILYQVGHGLTAEEIVDAFDRIYAQQDAAPTRSGEMLAWGLLHGRRRILPIIESLAPSGAPQAAEVTKAEVRAKHDELREAGVDHGIGSIARALNASESTVRRRLGRLK